MSVKAKIVVAAINAACLAVTLIFPSSTTPFAVLITVVTVTAWAFTTYTKPGFRGAGLTLYVVLASLLAMLCIVFGLSSKIVPVYVDKVTASGDVIEVIDHYAFKVSNEAFALAGVMIDYTNIAIIAFGIVVLLMILEIIATAEQNQSFPMHSPQTDVLSITNCIHQKIGHIK